MLPERKTDVPKCLYLDQNFWIGMAQAANGKAEGKRFEPAFHAIQRGVDSGKLIVPISLVNVIETAIPGRVERR